MILLLCVVALGYDFHNIGLESASLYILGVTLIFHGLYKRNYYSLSIPVLLIPLVYLNSIMVLPVLFLITLFIEFLSLKDLKINVGLSLMCLMSLMFLFIVTVLNSYNYEVDLLVNPVRWIESVPHFHNIFLVTFCVSSIGLISSKISNLNHESFIDFFTLLVTTIALYFAYSFSHIDNLLMGSIVFAGLMFSYEKNSTIFLNKVYNIIPIILAIILADNFITVISILSVIVLIRTIDAQSKLLKLIPFIVLTHFVFIKGVSDSKYVEILYFSSFLLMILNVRLKQVFRNVRYE
ncbi:MAG: hypothetical protein GY909_11820 [Oligoflexia bacterium]|nr:hypothetical protein [Oligoflexia bacterium]